LITNVIHSDTPSFVYDDDGSIIDSRPGIVDFSTGFHFMVRNIVYEAICMIKNSDLKDIELRHHWRHHGMYPNPINPPTYSYSLNDTHVFFHEYNFCKEGSIFKISKKDTYPLIIDSGIAGQYLQSTQKYTDLKLCTLLVKSDTKLTQSRESHFGLQKDDFLKIDLDIEDLIVTNTIGSTTIMRQSDFKGITQVE
jgi:hypothetical protein